MSLLFPLGLLALVAALLPLLVHLARRHPYTPLDFAALRWLRAQVRPRQRIRFDDWPLLLVRVLLLVLLALLLARPALTGTVPAGKTWTVVAPGLDAQALRGDASSDDWHWLAPGFPGIDQPAPPQQVPLASLLRELDARLPAGTPLVVHVPDPLPGLDGQRLQLSRTVQWLAQAAAPAGGSSVTGQGAPRLRLREDAPPQVQRWLGAMQRAWNGRALASPLPADVLPDAGEIGVWSSTRALPANWQDWVEAGGSVLTRTTAPDSARVLLRDDDGAPLLLQQPIGHGRLLHLSGTWDVDENPTLRQDQLPRRLQLVLQGEPTARLGDAHDHTPVQVSLPAQAPVPREMTAWLALLILLVFALERWMASSPRRRRRA